MWEQLCASGGLIRVEHFILGPSFGAFTTESFAKEKVRVLISSCLSSSNGSPIDWTLIEFDAAKFHYFFFLDSVLLLFKIGQQ